ncbi:hypothetical protein IWX49DRAFT_163653 [Phyllosticta citricarpa]|uniref:Uncharacterized protein n=2 Tax=Phyllosticta TaxID=121621 RepID=A0ABR1MRT1_9PEZI
MAPGTHKALSFIPSFFGHRLSFRSRAKDDHNYGNTKHRSSHCRHKSSSRCKHGHENRKRFSVSDQVNDAARELVQLRLWEDYGSYIENDRWYPQLADHVLTARQRLDQVVQATSDMGSDWRTISEKLGQEQKVLEMLRAQEIPVRSRQMKEDFPLTVSIEEGLVRAFGYHGVELDEWIWELHEHVRRKMIRSFAPDYNFFEELARRKDWVTMGDSLARDRRRLERVWRCNERIDLHRMQAALINCASYFFLEFPRISDDGVKHFYPRRDWLNAPSSPRKPTHTRHWTR